MRVVVSPLRPSIEAEPFLISTVLTSPFPLFAERAAPLPTVTSEPSSSESLTFPLSEALSETEPPSSEILSP